MISALDASVILDVLTADSTFAEDSEAALRRASAEGQLVVCECTVSEIYPAFSAPQELDAFLQDWAVRFVPSTLESARLAGRHFAEFVRRGGRPGRIVADFLIGAHARVHADRLVARDRGYLRDYFHDLVVLDPARPPRRRA